MPEFAEPVIQNLYEIGLIRIEQMQVALALELGAGVLPEDLPLPFVCYLCDQRRWDFCLITGDGLPICRRCFDRPFGAGSN